MKFEDMNEMQRRLHNAGIVLGCDGDEYGFEQLQFDALKEIGRLESENRTLRIAQKACETCGPNSARWEDDAPANLEAAAEDAHKWLAYLQARSKTLTMDSLQWDKLDRCMEALRGFMRPNAAVQRPSAEGAKVALEPPVGQYESLGV